jgi:hypothetical protein
VRNTRKTEPRRQLAGAVQRAHQSQEPASQPHDGQPDSLDLISALEAASETVYQWDFQSDRMTWAGNAARLLELSDLGEILTGAAFHQLIDADFASQIRQSCG